MLRAHFIAKPFFAFVALLAIAGCTATPLYQPGQGEVAANAVYAQTIAFTAPTNRVGQMVRNAMIFRLYGGNGEPSGATLQGKLVVSSSTSNAFRTTSTSVGQTSAALVTVSGTLTITDTATGQVVEKLVRSTIAPIDRGSQQFANERALLDAENRAGEELGELFATLLASRVLR